MLRAALLILSGNAAASLLTLARNLLIARLIPVEDYGIAATFAIAMAVVEMASQLGLQQQIVQAKDGDNTRFQAALQGFQVLRGVIAGAVLFFLAGPIAAFLGIPEVAWAYQLIAAIPVLNALQHFDIHRLNRQMRFWPLMLTGAVPAVLSLILVWPLAAWLGDYRVMLYAILAQAVVAAVTSHLCAERPYRLVLDLGIMGQSFRFGWPLLLNGILLFAVFQGDKLIVGRELGMAPLAIFAMGMTLTLTPTLVMAKSVQNFFLPQLSQRLDDRAAFLKTAAATVHAVFLASLTLYFLTIVIGPYLIDWILGDKYAELLIYLPLLAAMQALRVAKTGPSILALALARTTNPFYANIPRVMLLGAAWYMAVTTGDMKAIIWVGILGEAIGLILSFILLRDRVPMRALVGLHKDQPPS